MKLSEPRVWLSATSLLVVIGLVVLDLERATPGPLSSAHARDPELASPTGCVSCHGENQDMAAACLDCHDPIERDLAEGRGLHGTLTAYAVGTDPRRCDLCHVEHHGDEVALVDARAFALAGVADPRAFDHRRVGSNLTGAHDELACTRCHEHAEAALLPTGEARFGGLTDACATCHEDPHEGRMAQDCATCHGQAGPFAEVASFVHDPRFPLVGGHGGLDCATCHEPGSAWELEAVAGLDPPPTRSCTACHDDPHRAEFTAVFADRVPAGPDSCVACHDPEAGAFHEAAFTAADHARAGFPLDAPHDRLDCAACHPDGATSDASRPARAPNDCAACHTDPHAGQFAARACVECHGTERFRPHLFDVLAHGRTAFPLEGAHAGLECARCHLDPPKEAPRRFTGLAHSCEDCHVDPHAGAFVDVPAAPAGTCAACHDSQSFTPTDLAAFDHAATGFALVGAHARAACATCHPAVPPDPTTGRDFARASAAFGGPITGCASCHADPHAGRFGSLSGNGDCARCHDTERFEHAATDFDHAASGFPLRGAHRQTACASCHRDVPPDPTTGRSYATAADTFGREIDGCAACHADPHAGAFDAPGVPPEVDGRAGCARCHVETSFRARPDHAADFDHARWTGYALEGAHAAAACAACHAALPAPDERGRSYGRAAGTSCADCHRDPHLGQFRAGAARADCARCHGDPASFAADRFDHARDSRFPLDGDHADLACGACHKPWPVSEGREIVRYKPLGTRCGDCHGFGGQDR